MKNVFLVVVYLIFVFSLRAQDSTSVFYHDSGVVSKIEYFSKGELDSTKYYTQEGYLFQKSVYDSTGYGTGEEYYFDGSLAGVFKLTPEEVIIAGSVISYHRTGQRKRIDASPYEYIEWYANGNKKEEAFYDRDSVWTHITYFEDGQMNAQEMYLHGNPHGEFKEFYGENGQQKFVKYYFNGLKEGTWREWYITGVLKSSIQYVNHKNHGKYQAWYFDGSKSLEGEWKNGHEVGVYRKWYFGGQIWFEKHYNKKGQRHGSWKYWHSNGREKQVCFYEKGKLEETCVQYDENGTIIR